MSEKKSSKKKAPGKKSGFQRGRQGGSSKGPKLGNVSKNVAFWLLIILLPITLFNLLSPQEETVRKINYSQFMQYVQQGRVQSVTIMEKRVLGKLKGGGIRGEEVSEAAANFETFFPFEDSELVQKLDEAGVEVTGKPPAVNWMTHLMGWIPWILIIFIWLFFMRQLQGGGGRAFSFGKSKAKLFSADKPKVTFKDVAGCDEAKQELEEVIDFLKSPRKFQKLGGRLPKGALLLGAPGTGKTLLARAVAGEAEVPFFSMSGSDFVEMFVGVGASRVRDLFEQGKNNAPCIIFIDEIDAVGRHRGAGLGGGHDEREQTLNQLLVEMDGFESNEGVILIAATNRPDVLDPALLRPGRFDRQIVVDRPDVRGREGILKVHMKDIPISRDVDIPALAKGTPGLCGAELESIVNEAALLAARRNRDKVMMKDFEDAKDKVMMGQERKSMLISDEEKHQIAVHEAGHTLVQRLTPGTDPVNKVTIIARGMALGVTQYLPERDRHLYSKKWCQNSLLALLGGRCAEQLILNEMTTGAGNDLERVTDLARKMVCTWGMSEALGPLTFGKKEEQIFLGREIAQRQDYSEETARLIDSEVRKLVNEAYNDATKLLRENRDKLERLAAALLEREVLDAEQINLVIAGKKLPPVDNGKPKTKTRKRSRKSSPASAGKKVEKAAAGKENKSSEQDELPRSAQSVETGSAEPAVDKADDKQGQDDKA